MLTTTTPVILEGYTPGQQCVWLISGADFTVAEADFSNFNLASGDTLMLYDGASTTAPQLTRTSGVINSYAVATGKQLLVVFTAASSGTPGTGFSLYPACT